MAVEWQGRSRGGKTGYEIFIFLMNHCGVRAAYLLLFFVVLYFIPAAPGSTGDIWRYSRVILKNGFMKSVFFIFRSYYSFGQSIIDKVAIRSGLSSDFHYDFDNIGSLINVISEGKGAIIICAHFGNWAAGEPFFRQYRTKLNIVMFDNEYESIKKVMEDNREEEAGFKIIPVNKDDYAHIFSITEALDKGELVCFMGDRYVHEENLMSASFMGYPVRFPSGPFLISAMLDVPVYFYYAIRCPGMTYKFSFIEADKKHVAKETKGYILSQYIDSLEKNIRLYPEQWYNYYDFWKLRSDS